MGLARRGLLLVVLAAAACAAPSTLIRGALVFDGTGAPGRVADVRIVGARIAAIGALLPLTREALVDAKGRALAPGFIDTHSHHDDGLFADPTALTAVSQGITTIVVGQDGESALPLRDFFARVAKVKVAPNVASFIGHNTVRAKVLGKDFKRAATPAELASMAALVREGMADGALGLATGLEYDPGLYGSQDEVIALAKIAAAAGGRYTSHVRNEDRALDAALDELLAIGRGARIPVNFSHAKIAARSRWGTAAALLRRLDAARAEGLDVTADVYPYTYWQSTLTVLFPKRDFESRASAEESLRELASPEGLLLSQFDPEPSYVGKTLAEIAKLRGVDAAAALIALVKESQALQAKTGKETEAVIGTSMRDDDVETFLAWPHANVCTDGSLVDRHPRAIGSFPRVLRRIVRERGRLSLPEALRKMTSLAARNAGLAERGRLRAGAYADLVLFDPATVADRATPKEPTRLSTGIERVWVNGQLVFAEGRVTGARPGMALRRAR